MSQITAYARMRDHMVLSLAYAEGLCPKFTTLPCDKKEYVKIVFHLEEKEHLLADIMQEFQKEYVQKIKDKIAKAIALGIFILHVSPPSIVVTKDGDVVFTNFMDIEYDKERIVDFIWSGGKDVKPLNLRLLNSRFTMVSNIYKN